MNPDHFTQNSNYSFRGNRGGGGQFRGYGRGRGDRGGGRGYGRGYGRGRGGRGGGGGGGFYQQQPNFDQELKMDQPPDFSPEALERNYAQFYSPLFTRDPWGSGVGGVDNNE